MDNIISFTPAELIAVFLGLCGSIITISTALGIIAKMIDKAREPEKTQNTRLDNIDKTIAQFREYFTNDDNRFKAIEKSNKITQSALLALLKHSLNGNDKESLKIAEKSLEDYLLDK